MKFHERVILMLLDDRIRFLTVACMVFGLLAIGMFTDKTKDAALGLSMLGNLALGYQFSKKSKD